MTTVNLYKYIDGTETVITPFKREENDTPYCVRLIADDGKAMTDGNIISPCVDTHTPETWSEIDDPTPPDPEEEATASDYEDALERFGAHD